MHELIQLVSGRQGNPLRRLLHLRSGSLLSYAPPGIPYLGLSLFYRPVNHVIFFMISKQNVS